MPADVVGSRILPAQGQEEITIMDDYGTSMLLYVNVTDAANRQTYITDALTQQSANQAALETYATAHSINLAADKLAGLLAKQAAMQANGITVPDTITQEITTLQAASTTTTTTN